MTRHLYYVSLASAAISALNIVLVALAWLGRRSEHDAQAQK